MVFMPFVMLHSRARKQGCLTLSPGRERGGLLALLSNDPDSGPSSTAQWLQTFSDLRFPLGRNGNHHLILLCGSNEMQLGKSPRTSILLERDPAKLPEPCYSSEMGYRCLLYGNLLWPQHRRRNCSRPNHHQNPSLQSNIVRFIPHHLYVNTSSCPLGFWPSLSAAGQPSTLSFHHMDPDRVLGNKSSTGQGWASGKVVENPKESLCIL